MTTSEFEYYLLSELISMPDRVLAQQIELLIWNRCPIPNEPILEKFVELLRDSDCSTSFYVAARQYVKGIKVIKWDVVIMDHSGKVNHIRDDADYSQCPWFTVGVARGEA